MQDPQHYKINLLSIKNKKNKKEEEEEEEEESL
jgi:hypothetical protein